MRPTVHPSCNRPDESPPAAAHASSRPEMNSSPAAGRGGRCGTHAGLVIATARCRKQQPPCHPAHPAAPSFQRSSPKCLRLRCRLARPAAHRPSPPSSSSVSPSCRAGRHIEARCFSQPASLAAAQQPTKTKHVEQQVVLPQRWPAPATGHPIAARAHLARLALFSALGRLGVGSQPCLALGRLLRRRRQHGGRVGIARCKQGAGVSCHAE